MITVGLDVGRDAHRYLVVDTAKNELDGGLLSNKTWAFEPWALQLEELGENLRLVVESGNGLSTPIEQCVLARGWEVVSVAANSVKSYRENVMGMHDKTDESDAEAIAKLGVDAESRLVAKVQPRRELRRLVRERARLVKEATVTKNRLRQALAEVWPELDTKVIPKLESRHVNWLLATHPDPRELTNLGVDKLSLLAKAARIKPDLAILTKIVALATNFKCSLPDNEARLLFTEIRLLAKRLKHLRDDIAGLEDLVHERTSSDEQVQVLVTMPGCGATLASAIVAEIQDIRNFPTEARLASYAGLALRRHQTGKSANFRLPQMRANRRLKRAILLLALLSGQHNPKSASYLAKKRKEGKKPLQALRSLGRHLARVIHAMLRNVTPYQAS